MVLGRDINIIDVYLPIKLFMIVFITTLWPTGFDNETLILRWPFKN